MAYQFFPVKKVNSHMTLQHIMYKSRNHHIVWIAILWLLSTTVSANQYCGELTNGFGPYDYTDPTIKDQLSIVENHHFDRNVEKLISGVTGSIGGGLDYTLRAFPNHHRALHAMSKLALRDKTPKPEGAGYTTLCYFDRAIRFKSNDAMVRVIFGGHWLRKNKLDLALEQFEFAVNIEPDDPMTNYNLGLIYLKKKNYDKALHFAKKAYAQNFPLLGLKNKLVAVGKWKK